MKRQKGGKTKIKRDIKIHMTRRVGYENELDTKLEKLLDETCKNYPQHFHGGELNAICCKQISDNIDIVLKMLEK